jgi:hypothetical protein
MFAWKEVHELPETVEMHEMYYTLRRMRREAWLSFD